MIIKRKKRVLFSTEFSNSSTGYGVYGQNLLSRLHSLGKYEIAEFASFVSCNDIRDGNIKHHLYCNEPSPNDEAAKQQYATNDANKTGAYRFDKVLLDFRPDIVCEFRDTTMFEYEMMTPLRKFFYWLTSPSLDSAPQLSEWVSTLMNADQVLNYTDYAGEVLRKEGGGKINIAGTAYTGANFDIFKPISQKDVLRQSLGLNPNAFIVSMNGRNQIRKMFIELIKAFRLYLDKIQTIDPNLYNNSFLYLHTTLPDLKPWSISKALVQFGLTNHTLVTYNCTKCNKFFPNKYQETITSCRFCGGQALLPRVGYNISPDALNQVYNVSDIYVQYANRGAAEFPLIEAAAAGCNIMAVDYAGTGDVCRRLGGIPIKVLSLNREINVDADAAVPCNNHLSDELVNFARRPRQINLRNGYKLSEIARKKFSWDKNAEIWEKAIDNANLTGMQGKWHQNINYQPAQVNPNDNIYNWVYSILNFAIQEPHLKHTVFIDEMIKWAEVGIRSTGNGIIQWGRQELTNILNSMVQNKQTLEALRSGQLMLPEEDWLKYAETKVLANI